MEVVLGVAIGIAVADLLVGAIGTGAWQVGLIVALALALALLLGAGTVLTTQAAISAIIVVAIEGPSTGLAPDRFLDALTGGLIAVRRQHGPVPAQPARRPP